MSGYSDLLTQQMQNNIDNGQYSSATSLEDKSTDQPNLMDNSSSGTSSGLSSMMSGMAMGAIMSDQNVKTNITKTSVPDINQFVKSLQTPKSYDYKDKRDGTHTEGGLMAQDLQKSKIGASTVIKTPRGLAVDTNKLTPILATIMSHKIKELEDKIDSALHTKFRKK